MLTYIIFEMEIIFYQHNLIKQLAFSAL